MPKHTPLTSDAERGIYGAAYGAKKAGKSKPDYVPESVWELSLEVLKMHLEESAGKDLPEHVKDAHILMKAAAIKKDRKRLAAARAKLKEKGSKHG